MLEWVGREVWVNLHCLALQEPGEMEDDCAEHYPRMRLLAITPSGIACEGLPTLAGMAGITYVGTVFFPWHRVESFGPSPVAEPR